MYYFDTMQAKLKFLINFYDPRKRKMYKAGDVLDIEVNHEGVALDRFWRDQLKFNQISESFELNSNNKPKSKK